MTISQMTQQIQKESLFKPKKKVGKYFEYGPKDQMLAKDSMMSGGGDTTRTANEDLTFDQSTEQYATAIENLKKSHKLK